MNLSNLELLLLIYIPTLPSGKIDKSLFEKGVYKEKSKKVACLTFFLSSLFYFANAFLCNSTYPSCPAVRVSSRYFNKAFSMGSNPGVLSMFCNLPLCPLLAM